MSSHGVSAILRSSIATSSWLLHVHPKGRHPLIKFRHGENKYPDSMKAGGMSGVKPEDLGKQKYTSISLEPLAIKDLEEMWAYERRKPFTEEQIALINSGGVPPLPPKPDPKKAPGPAKPDAKKKQ